jgi:hypothetical protein
MSILQHHTDAFEARIHYTPEEKQGGRKGCVDLMNKEGDDNE